MKFATYDEWLFENEDEDLFLTLEEYRKNVSNWKSFSEVEAVITQGTAITLCNVLRYQLGKSGNVKESDILIFDSNDVLLETLLPDFAKGKKESNNVLVSTSDSDNEMFHNYIAFLQRGGDGTYRSYKFLYAEYTLNHRQTVQYAITGQNLGKEMDGDILQRLLKLPSGKNVLRQLAKYLPDDFVEKHRGSVSGVKFGV